MLKNQHDQNENYGVIGKIERTKEALDKMGEPDLAKIDEDEAKKLIIADEDVVQGEVSDDSIADAQTLELDEFDQRATVKFQLGELFDSIQEGEELPAWASPAVRRVSAIMQQRVWVHQVWHLFMVQAVMESGIPIATADANSMQKYNYKI